MMDAEKGKEPSITVYILNHCLEFGIMQIFVNENPLVIQAKSSFDEGDSSQTSFFRPNESSVEWIPK